MQSKDSTIEEANAARAKAWQSKKGARDEYIESNEPEPSPCRGGGTMSASNYRRGSIDPSMKVAIQGRRFLRRIGRERTRQYLAGKGWARVADELGGGTYWESDPPGFEIMVPGRRHRRYAQSVAELVETLAKSEDRSQLEVYLDLTMEDDELAQRLRSAYALGAAVTQDDAIPQSILADAKAHVAYVTGVAGGDLDETLRDLLAVEPG